MTRYGVWLTSVAMVCLAGCASMDGLAPHVAPKQAEQLLATQSLAQVPVAPDSAPAWWRRFGDAQLDGLVDEALQGSPTVQAAMARVERARAVAGMVDAAGQPRVDLGLSVTRELFSENYLVPPPLGGTFSSPARLAGEFSYELDLWGRNKARLAGALSEAAATEADAAAARLMLSVAVARSYVALDHLLAVQALLEKVAAQQADVLRLAEFRVRADLEPQAFRERAIAQSLVIQGQQSLVEQQTLTLRYQLAALLGQGPDRGLAIAPPALNSAGALALPSVLPADLIGLRPDVAALRARVEAAFQYVKAAKTEFYPNVNLVAFAGLQALQVQDLLKSGSQVMGVGPAVHLPLFDGGRLRQQLATRYAEQDGVVAEYNQAVSEALRDIADAVGQWRSADVRLAQQQEVLIRMQTVRDHAKKRHDAGLADQLSVAGAEIEVLGEQAKVAELRARRFDAAIALARAAGGGYHHPAATTSP